MLSAPSDSLIYRVDDIDVDITRGCLVRDGSEVHLKPKTFRVFVHLLSQRERLVTREELMDLFWKDTAVTDDALSQCIAEVRRALGDQPRNSTYLKTIPRMGYRFVGPVEEVRRVTVTEAPIEVPLAGPSPMRKRVAWLAAVALLVASLGGAALWTGSSIHAPTNGRRQIAVLPFENRSGQSDLDWLREGLPDMLSTTLSRSSALDVVSRDQVYARARRTESGTTEVIKLARAVHADAAITGSYSKLGNSMRVDARVVNIESGAVIAAEDIFVDRQENLLSQIDFLAARLAGRIAPQSHDQDRRVFGTLMTSNLDAYRYYLSGLEKAEALQTPEAITLFEKAASLDPGFAMAYARIGYAYAVTDISLGKGRRYLDKAFRMSEKLTDKDRRHLLAWSAIANQDYQGAIRRYSELITEYPNDAEAYFRLARLHRGESRHEDALELLHHANAIDPEDPKIYNALSAVLSEMGRHAEAISMANRYLALAPSDPNAFDTLGLCYQTAGQYEPALDAFGKALELKPDFLIASLHRSLLYAQMGRLREALRDSLLHAHSGGSVTERRRGWGQAAFIYWRLGRTAEARSASALAWQLEIEDADGWDPTFRMVPASAAGRPAASMNQIGRGGRYGTRMWYFCMADEAGRQGRTEEMFRDLQQLLRARTSWGEFEPFEDALADAYFRSGRLDEAIPEYERALRLFPGMARARYHLALAYQRKGQIEAARNAFRQFLDLWKQADPTLPELVEARRAVATL